MTRSQKTKTQTRRAVLKHQIRQTKIKSSSNKEKIKLNPADEHVANIIEKSLNNGNISEKKEEDEDKLFCMSLNKEIKKVPEAMRLKTKIEIYNLILQIQTTQQTQPSSLTESPPSNQAATSFVQPLIFYYITHDYT